jgi:putative lipoic acid-binding regulatory protein
MDRDGAIELLNKSHTFPGPFDFRIVARTGAQATVLTALAAAGGEAFRVLEVDERPSSKGAYTRVRVTAVVSSAELVLDLYAVLGGLDAVLVVL